MLPLDRQRALVEQYAIIPDAHERLAVLADRARRQPPLPAKLKTAAALVPGCTSRVWLVCTVQDGLCHFQIDADSTLVRGLALLLGEVYEGAASRDIVEADGDILVELKLAENLSPTRRFGLEQVRRTMQEFAARWEGKEGA